MRRRVGCRIAISIAAVVCLTYGTAWAQQNWRVPRTADGHPDLQGVWANNSATPMQRPAAFEGKESLTDEELAVYQARAAELHANEQAGNLLGPLLFQQVLEDPNFREFDAGTGNYNSFWLVERELDNRTSLIVDPSNGRIPPVTEEARERQKQNKKAKKRKARIPRDAVEWNGHHYKAYAEGVSHSVAQKRCEMMGGHLARIENAAENQFLTRLSVKFPLLWSGFILTNHTGMWIDGSDAAREGVWRFSNNAPMKYTNWGSGEPNNEHGSAHNVELKTGVNEATRLRQGFWNDLPGGWRGKGFICEWDE